MHCPKQNIQQQRNNVVANYFDIIIFYIDVPKNPYIIIQIIRCRK